jgi:hypothetical protein
LSYQVKDEHPFFSKTYYRLKQTDFDGRFSWSDIIVISGSHGKFAIESLHPNPSSGKFELNFFTASEGLIMIRICDSYGREVRNQLITAGKGSNHLVTDIAEFPAGPYQLFLTDLDSETTITRKMIMY